MGTGGLQWDAGDTLSSSRLNQKGLFIGTGAQIAALTPLTGQHAFCTSTGSGFTSGVEYRYNGSAWKAVSVQLDDSHQLNAQGEMRFADSDSSNYVGFKAPGTVSANKIWTLPSTDGIANQFLSTDGSGTLSWASAATSSNLYTWRVIGTGTLGSAGDTLAVTNIPVCKDILVFISKLASGASDVRLRFNNDSGANYASRQSSNGAADSTSTAATQITITQTGNTVPEFSVLHITNLQSQEKIVEVRHVGQSTAGGGNPPNRAEVVGKWANTASYINEIDIVNGAAGDYNTGTEIIVLGLTNDANYTDAFTDLGSVYSNAGDTTITISSFTAKKYLIVDILARTQTSTMGFGLRCNNDGAGNYAYRASTNAAADITAGSNTSLQIISNNSIGTGVVFYATVFIINISAQEKLAICLAGSSGSAGAANAPDLRIETVTKWANTAAQITRLDLLRTLGTGTLIADCKMSVRGYG